MKKEETDLEEKKRGGEKEKCFGGVGGFRENRGSIRTVGYLIKDGRSDQR